MSAGSEINLAIGLPLSLVTFGNEANALDPLDRAAVDPERGNATPHEMATFLEDTQPLPLPENVIPFPSKNPASGVQLVPGLGAGVQAPEVQAADSAYRRASLVEADPTNPAHQPTALFGRAAVHLPQWPLVLVLGSIAVSLLVVLFDSFRGGVLVMGAAMFLAFFLRLVLNDRDAGMLKVRSRVTDLVMLGFFAITITGLAISIPATV